MIMSIKQLVWSCACALLLVSTNASSYTRRDTSGKQTERRRVFCDNCNKSQCKGCGPVELVERRNVSGCQEERQTDRARSRNPQHNHIHHKRKYSDERRNKNVRITPVDSAE